MNSPLSSVKQTRLRQGMSMCICSPQNEEKPGKEREIHQKLHSLASAAVHAASSALPHGGGAGVAGDARIAVGVPPTIPIRPRSCLPAPNLPPAPELQADG